MFLKSVVIRTRNWLLIATKTREFNTPLRSLTIYKITQIVRALWLAERRVCMRVCKHGCDVKMFCFSRANHAGTNLKKVLSWKVSRQIYFMYPFPPRLKLGKSLQTSCVFFFCLSWHFKRVFWEASFCKTRTAYLYKLRVQDFATGKNLVKREFCIFSRESYFIKVIENFFCCVCISWYNHSRGWEPEFSIVMQTLDFVSNSPNPSGVYIRLCKHKNVFYCLTGNNMKTLCSNKKTTKPQKKCNCTKRLGLRSLMPCYDYHYLRFGVP